MPTYQISEHRGHRVKAFWVVNFETPEKALRCSTCPPLKPFKHMGKWLFIDDGTGGGALIDPNDPDHCLRADPRPDEDEQEDDDAV